MFSVGLKSYTKGTALTEGFQEQGDKRSIWAQDEGSKQKTAWGISLLNLYCLGSYWNDQD
jgi:hypothetical protein